MDLNDRVKYPKTLHFPWSPGLQNDDRVLEDPSCFNGKMVVMTEKLDGENTTMYRDAIHARSVMDMASHPSRSYIQAIHSMIRSNIPDGWRICGENLYAKHSIHYTNLYSLFCVFSIWDNRNYCLDWEETEYWCELLGLMTVPTIWSGMYDEAKIKDAFTFREVWNKGDEIEGYVVRNSGVFAFENFQTNVAKYVRKNHVQTSEHWLKQSVVRNELYHDCD